MKEEFEVYQDVFSKRTLKSLTELARAGHIDYLQGEISTGKEANVFSAYNEREELVAVKIYLIETSNFVRMWKYIKGDPRFSRIRDKKKDIIYAWAKKEYRNLFKAINAGIRAPKPIARKNNVVIMSFIGEKAIPSPLAKDKPPEGDQIQKWFKEIKTFIKDLYQKESLVHSDLSKFNILNQRGKPVIIDWSAGVLRSHPQSSEFLKRDIKNIFNWFRDLGIETGKAEDFFEEVIENGKDSGRES